MAKRKGIKRGNVASLTPFSKDEDGRKRASEAGKIGGFKSGITKREKKLMRDSLDILCSLPLNQGDECDISQIKSYADLKNKNITIEQAMLIKQISKAMKGDTQALVFIRDTMGQKPVDEKKIETNSTDSTLLQSIVEQLK